MFTFSSISNWFVELISKPDNTFLFCTVKFWVLFVIFYALYLLVSKAKKSMMMTYVILFGLLVAYKANGWLMALLPATALISWGLTDLMKKARTKAWKRFWLIVVVLVDLAPLIYFKYTNFFISIFNDAFATNFSPLSIILPVGISFYTFQAISYSVDTYKQKITYDVSLLEYCFYITFFPLLFAGPITRTDTLVPQLRYKSPIDGKLVNLGLWLIILGLLKKGIVADYLAQYTTNMIFDNPADYSGFEVAMGVFGYAMQIYCDFSGYSDLSIGLAAIMGFRLLPNFNFPYKSRSVTEFWRRWHISLSTWFRDYVYIPLGGNRKGKCRTYLNNFITMLVAGLWHGSTWMFIIWGALHGAALVIHKFCKSLFLDKIKDNIPVKFFSWLITFVFVLVTWIFFASKNMDDACVVFSKIGTDFDWAYLVPFVGARTMWTVFALLAFILHFTPYKWNEKIKEYFVKSPWIVKLLLFALAVQLVINFSQDSVQPLIYAQF